VSAESGQTVDTITYNNILDMRARIWGYKDAIWMTSQDAIPQLAKLNIDVGTGGAWPVYMPSAREDLPDMLLGRPVIYTESVEAIGDEGDIWLVNWSQYLEGILTPLESAESIHVRFENHERAFKFFMENAGSPWWRSAYTPKNSLSTQSPFVTLAAR
jgi:HK97 family phage major capsid protein